MWKKFCMRQDNSSVDAGAAAELTSRLPLQTPIPTAVAARGEGDRAMKVLCVHPSGLMYTEIFLRLEPLGLELVAAAIRKAGHEVRLIDLQADKHKHFFAALDDFRPEA